MVLKRNTLSSMNSNIPLTIGVVGYWI